MFLDTTCLFHIILLECMFSVLIFGSRQLIGILFIGEDRLSHSQLSSVVYGSLCKVDNS